MMRDYISIGLVAASLIGAGIGGYWLGHRNVAEPPVAGTALNAQAPAEVAKPDQSEKKPLFYRNPMGLPDTSPVPKKDSMGMDYIPVYADDQNEQPGTVKVNLDRVQKLGVRTETVSRRLLMHGIRAVGSVQIDERKIHAVSLRFDGWIERLLVNTTGEAVKRGQPLMQVYSPELILAQEEYLVSQRMLKGAPSDGEARQAAASLADAALTRLRALDAPRELSEGLARGNPVQRRVTLRSPTSGVVLEKMVVEGVRFGSGEMLYRIADISTVWVIVDVFEQDLSQIHLGQLVNVQVTALPGRNFQGKVAYLYPTVTRETRTAKVRIEIPNPGFALRADMYASVEVAAPQGNVPVIVVPASAIIDSGVRQVVLVERGEGRFEPRAVRLGARADDFVEILEGVADGERVVVAANFLIDAESNLRSALGAFQAPANSPVEETKP